MTVTCAIIDDEPLALNLLESYVKRTPFLELDGVYSSAVEALDALRSDPVDLIFLDIQMPQLTGVELSRIIPEETRIVFTTAFGQYALEGFRVGAIDYLLKPVSYTDFLEAAGRALDWFERTEKQAAGTALVSGAEDSLFVKSEHKLIRVFFKNILYVEGLKDYVKLCLATRQRPLLTLSSMKAFEDYLPPRLFMRVHRSFIVNTEAIEQFDRNGLLIGDRSIPVSDAYREQVMAYIAARTPQGSAGIH